MTHPSHNEPAGKGSSTLLWLLLLLLVLILALVLSDYGGTRQFGQKAYSNAVQIAQKVSGMARSLYTCGIQGCPEKASDAERAATPGKMVVAGPETNAALDTTSPSAPATESQGATPPVPEHDSQGQVPDLSSAPQYPSYPEQAPDASFGNRDTGGSFPPPNEQADASAPYSNYSNAPMEAPPQQEPSYPPPMMAPMQPMPGYAPAKPEYPAFPQHPSFMAAPMMPPQMMAPQAANPKLDHPNMDTGHGIDSLNRARESAQAGYFSESVREYHRHLASFPDDGDAWGELGNVYLKMGRYNEASQSYYEAAARLIDAGYFDAVAAMMPIIQTHEPMLASLLNKRMAAAFRDNQDPRR